jgi:hypothetical protein
MKDQDKNDPISKMPEERRDFLRKALGAGFVAPVVATFSMAGLMARPAAAQSNQS